jgi:hypothetical protein
MLGDSLAFEFYAPTFQKTPMKMKETKCSKMLALKIHTLGNHPKERIQQVKPRYCVTVLSFFKDSLICHFY